MDNKLMWRVGIIVAVSALAAIFLWPPEEKINLGLDLKGGIHLVLRVETDDAIKAELQDTRMRLVREAEQEGVSLGAPGEVDVAGLSFQLAVPPSADLALLDDVIDDYAPGYEVDKDSGSWTMTMPGTLEKQTRDMTMRQALETIRNRVDQFGVAEPVIQTQSGERLLVQLPGVEDPERVKDLIGSTAFLEFREVVAGPFGTRDNATAALGGTIPSDTEVVTGDDLDFDGNVVGTLYWALKKTQIITGRDLRNARRGVDQFSNPAIDFFLNQSAAEGFGAYTGSHIGTQMAIVLDGNVKSAPRIDGRITDQGMISGSFSIQEAEDLSLVLRAGALPAALTFLEERTVGPSLGLDSVRRGVRAAVSGLVLVMLFMIVYYRRSGINANIALALNILLLMGAMGYLNATLTLPGIAGIILTIGMAVDANVLIFERIREELDVGKTVKSAVDVGFGRAFITILDANITTLIAALFLFQFGTGPVKGFAVTLSIGIIASMFTAVFVSRTIYMVVLGGKERVEALSI